MVTGVRNDGWGYSIVFASLNEHWGVSWTLCGFMFYNAVAFVYQ